MKIILKNMPANTSKQDIKDFFTPAVKGNWLRKSGEIASVSILIQKSIRTRIAQYHGLVQILPDSVAERAIKKLNGKIIKEKHVAVCEYKIRSWHNDQRLKKRKLRNPLADRRIGERREPYEEVISEELIISGKQGFHTKGW